MDSLDKKNTSSSSVSINVDAASVVKAVLIVVLFIFLYHIKDIVLIVLTAIVISTAIDPLASWIERKGSPRALGVIAVYLALLVLISGIFYLFIPILLNETGRFLSNFSEIFESLPSIGLMPSSDEIALAPETTGSFVHAISESFSFSINDIAQEFRAYIANLPGGVTGLISTLFGGILTFILIFVLSFYLTLKKNGVDEFLDVVVPVKHHAYIKDLWARSQRKIGLWIRGQFISALIIGLSVYIGLSLLGVPYAIVLAVAAFFLEFIPFIGPTLAAVPAVLIALVDGGLAFGLIVTLFYIIIQQIDMNVIYPLVVRRVVGVSPIVVILAIAVGAKLGGFLGVILAVPIAAAIDEYTSDVKKKHARQSEIIEEGRQEPSPVKKEQPIST